MERRDPFYVELPSNASYLLHKDNSISRYRVTLAHQLELVGDWECGLVEITYPRSWYNIKLKDTHFEYRVKGGVAMRCYFRGGYYSTAEELVTELRRTAKLANPDIDFYLNTVTKKLSLAAERNITVRVQGDLATVMGWEDNKWYNSLGVPKGCIDITNGKYNLLKWDKQERKYYPIRINLYEKGEINE